MTIQRHMAFSAFFFASLFGLSSCQPPATPPKQAGSQVYIRTDPVGAAISFDGIDIGISPATLQAVREGEHLISARKAGFFEERKTLTIGAEGRIVVELKLSPIQGLLLIHSIPPDAEVQIDGANRGRTPLLVRDLLTGQHRINVSLPGYVPQVRDMDIAGRTPQKIEVRLTSSMGQISVQSTPPGALVTLDGTPSGNTPCEIPSVSAGKHLLEMALQGHTSAKAEVDVQAGQKHGVKVTLAPLPAKVLVTSIPDKARIYIKDAFRGESPLTLTLPAGSYTFRAELQGFEPAARTNTLTAGENNAVEIRLVKNTGAIILVTEPADVSVFIDGRECGRTAALRGDLASQELKIDNLPQGQAVLHLTRSGYHDLKKTIDISANKTIVLNEKLVAKPIPFIPNVIVRTGPAPEQTTRGVLKEKYANGDTEVEVAPGIFKIYKTGEAVITPIPQEPGNSPAP